MKTMKKAYRRPDMVVAVMEEMSIIALSGPKEENAPEDLVREQVDADVSRKSLWDEEW